MMTPAQFEELLEFKRMIEAVERDMENSPYFANPIREKLVEVIAECDNQLKSVPVS